MNCIHAHSPVQGLFCFWALHGYGVGHTIARAGLDTQRPHSRRIRHPHAAPNKGDSIPESLTTSVYHAGGRWRASGCATWFRGHGSGAKENAPGALSFVGAVLRLPDPPLLFINKGESIMNHSAPDALDNLDRFTTQAQAVVSCLLGNDHFKDLSPTLIADTLWLVSDRLNDIQRQISDLSAPHTAKQLLADELEDEADNEPDIPPLPYMIREVVTNIPGWWHGEDPVIEYEAARWALGGNIERKPFKTLGEAEAWAQGGSHHG